MLHSRDLMVSMLKMFAKKKKAAVRHRDTIKRGWKHPVRGGGEHQHFQCSGLECDLKESHLPELSAEAGQSHYILKYPEAVYLRRSMTLHGTYGR